MDVAQHPGNSTQHRDARMQAMGEPHSISDVRAILGDQNVLSCLGNALIILGYSVADL